MQNKELKNVSKPHKGDDYNYIELGKLNLDLNINNETQPVGTTLNVIVLNFSVRKSVFLFKINIFKYFFNLFLVFVY